MYFKDIVNHLQRWIPTLTNYFTDNVLIESVSVNNFIVTIRCTNPVAITNTANGVRRGLKAGDGVVIKGIQYLYPIAKLDRSIPTVPNRIWATMKNKHFLSLGYGDKQKIEICGVTTDMAFNGIHELLYVSNGAYEFGFITNKNVSFTEQIIENEGYLALMHSDNAEITGTLNGYKIITQVSEDGYEFSFSINPLNGNSDQFFFPPTQEFNVNKATVRMNPRIAAGVSYDRSEDAYRKTYPLEKSNPKPLKNYGLWLYVHPESGGEYTNNEITTNDPGDINSLHNLQLQLNQTFAVTLFAISHDQVIHGNFFDLSNMVHMMITRVLMGSVIQSVSYDPAFVYKRILPLSLHDPIDDKAYLSRTFEYIAPLRTQYDDRLEDDAAGVPLEYFNIPVFKDIAKEPTIAEGDLENILSLRSNPK